VSELKFSIIIPNYNGRHYLKECIASIESCCYPRSAYEIIIVDNGSSDGSVEFIQRFAPSIRVIRFGHNTGFASAINSGASAAKAEFLIFLNNDMRVNPQWLSAFEDVVYGMKVDCVTGQILSWDASRIDFVEGILLFDGHALQKNQGAQVSEVTDLKVRPTFIACGGNMAVRRKRFLELGGFDPSFFAYTEDVDFSWRFNASGQSIYFTPDGTVYHHHQGTSSSLGVYNRGFLYEKNAFLNIFKNIDDVYFPCLLHLAWLTLIHRTREIITLNAADSAIFNQVPFSESFLQLFPSPVDRKFSRKMIDTIRTKGFLAFIGKSLEHIGIWIQKRAGMHPQTVCPEINISHPHIVSQMQAIWYILTNLDFFYEKRIGVQAFRTVTDKELFDAFPPWVVSTYPGDTLLFASVFFRKLLPGEIDFQFADISEVHGGT